jgi:hypothetical protein
MIRAAQEKDEKAPQCCLCPVTGGALKPSTDKGLWAHAACMQWIPEVTVEDVSRMEPVSHIKSIQKERWDLLCVICKFVSSYFQLLSLLFFLFPVAGCLVSVRWQVSRQPGMAWKTVILEHGFQELQEDFTMLVEQKVIPCSPEYMPA